MIILINSETVRRIRERIYERRGEERERRTFARVVCEQLVLEQLGDDLEAAAALERS